MSSKKFDAFKEYVNGKNITVVGIGISNLPLIKFLCENGAIVTACDKKTQAELGETATELKNIGVKLNCGEDYLDNLSGELIFKTPGMRFDHSALLKAKENGSIITSEMEVFFEVCPAKIIGITGSDGKTTTTTLVYNILCESGYRCHLGGNIGTPLLCRTDEINEEDIAVIELSSFQLHTMKKSADIAVITNMSPNHLDVHKSYEEYIEAKRNIYIHAGKDSVLVVNKTNEKSYECRESANGIIRSFGYEEQCDVYSDGKSIYAFGEKLLDISDIKIPGEHNVQNYMTAIAATYPLYKTQAVKKVAQNFGGVAHRIEFVREIDGVRYYNSSIDSSPNRTINTLKVFDKVILIAGGKDKGIPYDEIGEHIANKVKHLILIGKTGPIIKAALDKYTEKTGIGKDIVTEFCTTYEEAVMCAKNAATAGDTVLLSNASTSFDMFKNFEERGNLFKCIVNSL
ncbi:MAG: UDP-N-acetylmuramoyl-L-alanine--D-glutamate ligase [Clostridia bacterium]|nr:UDP-N-acetylmuramoyl-L-alanine--D-glutamate ligase [Clostridia bacterium]